MLTAVKLPKNTTELYSTFLRFGNLTDFKLSNSTNFTIGNVTEFDTKLMTTSATDNLCKKNETSADSHWSNDPLFYIITVLMFYAFSIIILMVKYIRREKQEAEFDNYYYDFVIRDKFQTPQFVNAQNMCTVLRSIKYSKVCDHDDTQTEEPVEECDKTMGCKVSGDVENFNVENNTALC